MAEIYPPIKKGPVSRAFLSLSITYQSLRITAGLKYQPVASNISVSSNNASLLSTGTAMGCTITGGTTSFVFV